MDKVNEVLSRETWDEADVNILLANQSILPVTAKVKLGLVPAPAIKAVQAPVISRVPTALAVEPATVIDTVVETPKKRGRKGKR